MKKTILIAALAILPFSMLKAQTKNDSNMEYKQTPKASEKVIGVITDQLKAGEKYDSYKHNPRAYATDWDKKGNPIKWQSDYEYDKSVDKTRTYSEEQLLERLMNTAKSRYREQYPDHYLRNFKWELVKGNGYTDNFRRNTVEYTYKYSASVVIKDKEIAAKESANEKLSMAIEKAFRNVREGSRVSIDQVTVWSGVNKEEYKDQIIDALLDKGYKVVAKEYLEKLYEEQQTQQSGIYNDRTTVQENNFSAVGYFVNVKVTETSLRVQVVNVSTGEYEGNATVNF